MESKKKIVLVVEDEMSLLHVLEDKLQGEGFDVFGAKNGVEGLKEASEIHPDMILLDILLPEMNGLEFLHKLRETDWGKEVKVIILTNLDTSEAISDAIASGGYSYLIKADWKIEDVVERIKREIVGDL